ncbi:hypothetical protein Agabi119p4_5081 [Agaricus bisporus var. burnettii]|uniref:Serine protease n=1 Tax=Agaricus bisporus var. burnettii TaxID=192524 RepID=A0A8H7KI05_AGABI|nr:hypothetical protein Agabi119p4_5081 [Agaricus bisporus var. burnettii]
MFGSQETPRYGRQSRARDGKWFGPLDKSDHQRTVDGAFGICSVNAVLSRISQCLPQTTTTFIQSRVAEFSSKDVKPPVTQTIYNSLTHNVINQMNANTPSIPSCAEAAYYYYGLPSEPALVARSSVNLWDEPTGPEAYLKAKELQPVGPHALNRVWESTVASAIELYLGDQRVQWTSLDPVRIGYAGSTDFPVVIWVGIIPNSLSSEKGLSIALGCHRILVENGNSDVHVEIRQSTTSLHARLYKPVRTVSPTVQANEPFATSLGLPICGANTTTIEGTGGFFFTDSNHPGKLFLITARHVLFHPDYTSKVRYEKRSNSQAAKNVFLLGDDALKMRINNIHTEIGRKNIILEQLVERLQNFEGQYDEETEEERTIILRLQGEAKQAIAALEQLLHNVTRDWDSPAGRTIGHTVFSPPLGFGVGPNQYTEDWAVVEINRSCIDSTNFVGNCIDLGTSVPVDEFTTWMFPSRANPTSFKYPGDRFLRFFGTIPDSEMGRPDGRTLDQDNNPVIMVIKRGGASDLTVGRLNSIRSVIRFYFKGVPGSSTREVAVFPRNSKSGAFSMKGDSGSVVVDGKGRIAGILTGGTGATEVSDCTYVTSINFLVDRLKASGYKPNIFPTVTDL